MLLLQMDDGKEKLLRESEISTHVTLEPISLGFLSTRHSSTASTLLTRLLAEALVGQDRHESGGSSPTQCMVLTRL